MAGSLSKYDREKGRFRNWLMAVVRRRLSEFWAGQGRTVSGSGDSRVQRHLEQVSAGDDPDQLWEREYRHSVFRVAVARIRGEFEESTWRAFWLSSVEGRKTREVAQSLGISEGAVYIARSRVIARLKKQVQLFED